MTDCPEIYAEMTPINASRARGFTLIEIMFVVALIAILAALAMPAYNGYINRAKIKTAQADLVALSLNFENRFQRMLAYPASNYANTAELRALFDGWSPASDAADFVFSTINGSASEYTVVATGTSGGVQGCAIELQSNGDRAVSNCSYSADGNWL